MSSMFDGYDTLMDNYAPTKPFPPCPPPPKPDCKFNPLKPIMPYATIDELGNITGYWWHYGDTINLEFDLEADGEITIFGSDVYLTVEDFLKSVKCDAVVTLYNFRHEVIAKKTFIATPTVVFPIDEELSKKLVKGTYYCTLTISSADLTDTIFYAEDCVFTVK